MDLGFSLPGKSNDTYPQHHEKVSILAEEAKQIKGRDIIESLMKLIERKREIFKERVIKQ
jgi:hypothetical protein